MLFTHAFTTAPVCSTSRSAFMTGMYQTTIGAHNHRSHRDDGYQLPPGVRVLTDWLRPAGYFTANVVHLTEDPDESFFRGTGKTDWNFTYEGPRFDSDRWDGPRHRSSRSTPRSTSPRPIGARPGTSLTCTSSTPRTRRRSSSPRTTRTTPRCAPTGPST